MDLQVQVQVQQDQGALVLGQLVVLA